MITKQCKNCGKEFEIGEYKNKVFCSLSCRSSGKFNPKYKDGLNLISRICKYCCKRFTLTPRQSRLRKGVYCSVDCAHKGRIGRNTYTDSQGYVRIYKPDHPFCMYNGMIMEHKVVMEKILGRYLKKGEVVHHMNHVKNDNRIDNLMLMTVGKHTTLHHTGSKHSLGHNLKTKNAMIKTRKERFWSTKSKRNG